MFSPFSEIVESTAVIDESRAGPPKEGTLLKGGAQLKDCILSCF